MKKKKGSALLIAITKKPKSMAKEMKYEKEEHKKIRELEKEIKHKPEKKKKEKTKKHKSDKKHASKGKFKRAVESEMKEFKEGKLHSGSKKGPIVTNPRQAIAISLQVARKKAGKKSK
jgi:hypothetical protein